MLLILLVHTDHCSCPLAPANGQITNCSGTPEVGFLISYQCEEEYRLQGNNSRECLPGGRWTGTDPTCSSMSNHIRSIPQHCACM